jgi:putative spermidine/putrescine transport system ATP-binding protein
MADVPGHEAVRLVPGTRVTVHLVERPVLVAERTVTVPSPATEPADAV